MAEEPIPDTESLMKEAVEAIKQEMAEARASEDLTPGVSLKLESIERRIAQIEQDIKFRGEGGISVTGNIIALDRTHVGSGSGANSTTFQFLVSTANEDGDIIGLKVAEVTGSIVADLE